MTSKVGCTQGSGLSSILTNIYSSDNIEDNYDHGEFSDDNLKWEAHEEEEEAIARMQKRIDSFEEWCKRNNVEAIKKKTKIMVFRSKKCPRPYKKVVLTLNDEEIEEVDYAKILGTIVDNQLNFEKHYERVVRSGYSSLNQIKRFCANQKIPSSDTLITLYQTLVRSIIDFSIPASVNISEKSLREISTLERSCLIYATKSLPKIDSDVLNLICNTLPLDLHLK
jgi:hypothetical protein